ncbi:cobalt-precorrin 5A hydrolase [Thiovibrio sp. JS02]
MRIALLAITSGGKGLAAKLAEKLADAKVLDTCSGISATLARHWQAFDGFVCVMAAGIVVRGIAPLLKDKYRDPCVLVLDDEGRHVVSLVSGHLGGGNALAQEVAGLTGGTAVITTASDTLGLPALDLWAKAQNLACGDRKALTRASARLVNSGEVRIFSEVAVDSLPQGFSQVLDPGEADIIVSGKNSWPTDALLLHPRDLVLGVGCNRGTEAKEFAEALAELLAEEDFSPLCIRNLASIDLKADEAGLLAFAVENDWRIEFFSKEQLNGVGSVTRSEAVYSAVGAIGVAEPAALLSAENNDLLVGKRKWQNVTLALARANFSLSARDRAG